MFALHQYVHPIGQNEARIPVFPEPAYVPSDRPDWLQSKAHHYNTPLGWAQITHPFHPLRGQRFAILKTRRVSGIDTLVLQGTSMGTFAVPQQWTDQEGGGEPKKSIFLDFSCLSALKKLVCSLDNAKKGVDK